MQLVRVNSSQIDPTEHIDCVAQATVNIKSAVYNNGTRIFSESAPIGHPFSILAGYLQDGRSGSPSRPRSPADISPETDPSSLPVHVPAWS